MNQEPAFSLENQECLAWFDSQRPGSPAVRGLKGRSNPFQLFVLDPPYNVNFRYREYRDTKPYKQYLFEQLLVLTHCARLLKEGGSVFYLNYPETAADIWGRVEGFLDKVEILTWVYHSHLGGWPLRRSSRSWLWFSKGEPLLNQKAFLGEYRNPEDPRIQERMAKGLRPMGYDWLQMEPVKNTSREKRTHPCQLPEKMVEQLILGASNPGDLVGDCYAGSGTTAICALRHERRFAGCELVPAYVQVALEAVETEKTKRFNSVSSVNSVVQSVFD